MSESAAGSGLGPLMIDVAGLRLSDEDRAALMNPSVGGLILFSRNYQSRDQLRALCDEVRSLPREPLLLAGLTTHWCGDPDGLATVLGSLENPARPLHVRPIDGPSTELERLPTTRVVERILDEPHRYVGQERLPFSQVPTWRSGAARPRPNRPGRPPASAAGRHCRPAAWPCWPGCA